jgi:hypothetical protein
MDGWMDDSGHTLGQRLMIASILFSSSFIDLSNFNIYSPPNLSPSPQNKLQLNAMQNLLGPKTISNSFVKNHREKDRKPDKPTR